MIPQPSFATTLPTLNIRGHELLPIIQGGMGIGISGHQLAGAVAKLGAIGTIASVELRYFYDDLRERTFRCKDSKMIDAANMEALDREIKKAREIAGPEGYIAVNVMKAVDQHKAFVLQACESGANAIIMGAGLPFDLPELVKDYPDVALMPILSEERGVRAILKRWMRRDRLPDAIIIENPHFAGGHLGAANVDSVNDPKFAFKRVIDEVHKLFDQMGIAAGKIPLIVAGGINSFDKMKELFSWGADGAQIGTPFAVTEECDAHPNFKRVLANALPKDITTFLSTAGLPARAVVTPWLKKYLAREDKLQKRANPERAACALKVECLSHCGLKDGNSQAGQFCIDNQLLAALEGNEEKGLFFRGSESLPFGQEIRSVKDLLNIMLTGTDPRK